MKSNEGHQRISSYFVCSVEILLAQVLLSDRDSSREIVRADNQIYTAGNNHIIFGGNSVSVRIGTRKQ